MAEVAQAFVSLIPSAKGFGKGVEQQVGPQLDSAGKSGGKRFGGVFGAAVKGTLAGIGIAGAVKGALNFLGDSIGEAREAQKVGAQTEAVIKSTGGAAGLTAKAFGTLATAISKKTGIDDEQIQAGENMLATFTNVQNRLGKGNDIFTQATKVSTDLAVATGVDQVKANVLLGKALNDPVKGISALSRIGVTFNDQQKKQIKTMMKAGDVAGAQKVILKELGKEFGGSAAAQATAGSKLAVAFGNLKEQIGTALLPVIDKLATVMTGKVVPALSAAISFLQANPGVLIAFGAALGVLALAFIAVQVAAFAIPLAIAALVGAIVYAYLKFETFRNIVNAVFTFLKTIVSAVLPFVVALIKSYLNIIIGVVKVFKGLFTGNWKLVWEGVKQIAQGIWGVIKTLLSAWLHVMVAIVKGIGGALLAAARWAFGKLKEGANAGAKALWAYVKSIPGKVVSALGDLGGLLLGAGHQLIQGLINGIGDMLGPLGGAMGAVADKIGGFLPGSPIKEGPLTSWNKGGAGKRLIDEGIIDGIIFSKPALAAAMTDLTTLSALNSSVSVPAGARLAGVTGAQAAAAGTGGISPRDLRLALDGATLHIPGLGSGRLAMAGA